jgi:hypothetical protein
VFRRIQRVQTQKPSEFPAGVFIHTEKGFFYVYSSTQRYRFITKRVLDSWNPQRVVECSENDPAVRRLKVVSKMKFRNGSLLYSQANGNLYLVSSNRLRHITNPDWMENLSLDRASAVWISQEEIQLHEMGPTLD